MLAKLRAFGRDTEGATVVEFTVVFVAFIAMMTFVIELSLYMFTVTSLEKAAEAGVRAAVVSAPVPNNLATVIPVRNGGTRGESCSSNNSPCGTVQTRTCRGTSLANCSPTRFDRILNHMRGYNAAIQRRNVTITYADVGIGFAGGPPVPMVTVTVTGLRFQTGIMGLLIGNDANQLGRLPTRSASMTAEDLS